MPDAARRAASASARKFPLNASRSVDALRFEPHKRVHLPAQFRQVREQGRRVTDAYFSLSVLANNVSHPRLGLAIATRTFGGAVERNRIKRMARESFRLNQHSLPAVDVTVAARGAARDASPRELRASLQKHWQTIGKRW